MLEVESMAYDMYDILEEPPFTNPVATGISRGWLTVTMPPTAPDSDKYAISHFLFNNMTFVPSCKFRFWISARVVQLNMGYSQMFH
jgi:hypothetical protein